MAEQAKDNLKKAAHDPNGVVVYDNFNFKSNVRELVGGKQDRETLYSLNLTTARLVATSKRAQSRCNALNIVKHVHDTGRRMLRYVWLDGEKMTV
jgi:hypothetical protein